MAATKRTLIGLTLSFALFALANTAFAADNGLITKQSRYSVKETVAPPKALVWEDDHGKVWLSYNSAEYLGKVIYARHGLADPPSTPKLAAGLKAFADYATK